MKKLMKKFSAIILSVVLIVLSLSTGFSAFAAAAAVSADDDQQISPLYYEGLENGGSGSGGSGSGSSGGWGDPTPPADDNDKPVEDELTADTLAWLIDVIVKDKTDSEADFNGDGKVDLLDVVFVKKKLAGINYGQ